MIDSVLSMGKVTKVVYGPDYAELLVRIPKTPGMGEGIRQGSAVVMIPLLHATDIPALVDLAIAANEAEHEQLKAEETAAAGGAD